MTTFAIRSLAAMPGERPRSASRASIARPAAGLRLSAGLIVAALAAVVPSSVQAAVDTPSTAPVQALEQAWNAGDGAAWGRAFWPDADSVNIYGGTLHGGEAMGARHGVVFAGRLKGTRMHSAIVDVRPIGRDGAVVQTVQTVDPPAQSERKLDTLKVFVTLVMERRHGLWKIAHIQNTTITPPAAE